MKGLLFNKRLLFIYLSIFAASFSVQARSEVGLLGEQVRLSGFASLVGGKTVSVGKRKSPLSH